MGETRESKARAYVALESKKVAKQYVGAISNLNVKLEDNGKKVSDFQMKLQQPLDKLAMWDNKPAKISIDISSLQNLDSENEL